MSRPEWQGPQPEKITQLFASIAKNYDRANNWITLGLAHLWREKLVDWSQVSSGARVLDCATGTGDLALAFAKKVGLQGEVVGTDFCAEMLALGPQKAEKLNLKNVNFSWADVTCLPYTNGSFAVASIAYGIRNVSDPVRALSEMARVVQSGGYVMVLETGDSRSKTVRAGIDFYFRNVVPRVGGFITGKRPAYEYLSRSSHQFPSREKFVELMMSTDKFVKVEFRSIMGGASFIYRGQVK